MKLDLWKAARSFEDLSEKEKGLLGAVLLLPSLAATFLFLLSPFF